MYKSKILNDFYEALFSTDFNDYATDTQDAKTDLLVQQWDTVDHFMVWRHQLCKVFAKEFNYDVNEVEAAIKEEPEFAKMLRAEWKELKEFL